MKTEIFNFNDIDADGYSTQNLVQVTGLDFDLSVYSGSH